MSLFLVIISHCAFSSLSHQGPGHSTEWLHKVGEDCFSEGGDGDPPHKLPHSGKCCQGWGGLWPAASSLAGRDQF